MVKEEDEDWHNGCADDHKDFLRGIRGWRMSVPKLCEVCQVSSSAMYCRAHRAHFCMVCDVKIHGGGHRVLSSSSSVCHERVRLCEVCEQAPASVTCKADAAALCVACDSDIHSANPLARRHERIPVTPFYESPNMGNTNNNKYSLDCNNMLNEDDDGGGPGEDHLKHDDDEDDDNALLNHKNRNDGEMCYGEEANTVAVSWLIPEVSKNNLRIVNGVTAQAGGGGGGGGEHSTVKDKLKFKAYLQSIDFLQDVDDSYVGLEFLASNGTTANTSDTTPTAHMGGTDSMVPVHTPEGIEHSSTKVSIESGSLDGEVSKGNFFRSLSLNHSVSSPSIDVGIVPDSSLNEISGPVSYNEGRGSYETSLRLVQLGTQFETMGREARVLRYREKRKNRKFEKTIRYASRKAYAETRPRIKGRFAKRTDVEGDGEMEHMYSSSGHRGYGVVPSF